MNTPKRGVHRYYIFERYAFYVDIDAENEVAAMAALEAFYQQHRRPRNGYREGSVNASLDDKSIRLVKSAAYKSAASVRSTNRSAQQRNGSAANSVPSAKAGAQGPQEQPMT